MKRFATLTIFVLLAMLVLAGTASAQMTGDSWANSNRSGEAAVSWDGSALLRNVPTQLTHTAFQLNTNSCASCHMTHTAVGANLLIADSTQNTCLACHNGTMAFLNVNAPATGTTSGAGMGGSVAAGTFGVQAGVRTSSVHTVTGGMLISGAPGGRRDGIAERGAWTPTFTCASCHAPHGSHSIRLLHSNPNNLAVRAIDTDDGVVGGRYNVSVATNVYLNDFVTGTNSVTGAAYFRYTVAGAPAAPWILGYSENYTIAGARTAATWTRIYHMNWDPNTVQDGVYADPTNTNWNNNARGANGTLSNMLTRHFIINFATGEVMQTAAQRTALIAALQLAPFDLTATEAAAAQLRIDVAQGLQVRARAATNHQANLVLGARQLDFIDPASYDAHAYNLFCAACHTDYLPTISAGNQTGSGVGIYSDKFRHTINRGASTAVSPMPVRGSTAFTGANLTGNPSGTANQMMCLSCHFAHGADASMMLLADNTRVSQGAGAAGTPTYRNQNDVSATLGGSSALKRYINQASCWHCHVRSGATVFINTPDYWAQFPQGPTW